MNELIERQTISIDGKEIKLKLFLRGDMKFLLMVMGMSNSVTADYACLWCKIFKEERWDTSKPSDYYNIKQRTLSSYFPGQKIGSIKVVS